MMSIGYGPKIYLRGPMPKHSYMVASATDLLLKSLFLENLLSFVELSWFCCSLLCEGTYVGLLKLFLLSHATSSAENHSMFAFSNLSPHCL
jgi:hypothetical protein